MWNRRSDAAASPELPEADIALLRPRVAEASRSVLGSSVTIKGEIQSREELLVDGEVEGTLVLHQRLTVGPSGKVRANVKAKEVIVQGSIHGNVYAVEKIVLRKDSSLVGDIRTAGIVIDDGAYFKGSIDIVRDTPTRAAAPEPVLARAAG